jgi:tRNA(adenine34) deaminase
MSDQIIKDKYFMSKALEEANFAFQKDEIPVGAVITMKDKIISRAHNMTEQLCDVTAHAEILAITSASNYLGVKYLIGCTIYVTLEPCVMCLAALKNSQIKRIVYSASDTNERIGFNSLKFLHKCVSTKSGILKKESEELLNRFFKKKRSKII